MNDRRTIVAILIAIALSCPGGSPKGCAALTVPIRETVATEISIPTAGIRNETKRDDPLGHVVLSTIAFARSLLTSTQIQFQQYIDNVLLILATIEAPFVQPNNDTSGDRHRRWASECQRWIDQLSDLSLDLSDAPQLLEDLAASLPNAIVHPFEFASNMTSSVGGMTVDAAGMAANSGFSFLWKFLTTQGLPWLHTTLEKLDQTNKLPPSFHDFIKNFDAAYNLAKLLGYVQ